MKKLSFGKKSLKCLDPKKCHSFLIELCYGVLEYGFDCSVIESVRGKMRQNSMFRNKKSKVQWPNGFHNVTKENPLARAIDVIPYPFPCWPDPKKQKPVIYAKDLGRMYTLIALFRAKAMEKGILIVTGSDWDNDWNFLDQTFDDLPHIQVASEERLKPKINESEYKELVAKAAQYDKVKDFILEI